MPDYFKSNNTLYHSVSYTRDPCKIAGDELPAEWNTFNVDSNLQTFLSGEIDDFGIYWSGQAAGPSQSFAQILNTSLTRIFGFDCSLENPCNYQFDCDTIGSHTASMLGQKVLGMV